MQSLERKNALLPAKMAASTTDQIVGRTYSGERRRLACWRGNGFYCLSAFYTLRPVQSQTFQTSEGGIKVEFEEFFEVYWILHIYIFLLQINHCQANSRPEDVLSAVATVILKAG